jgi:hypothetical protein
MQIQTLELLPAPDVGNAYVSDFLDSEQVEIDNPIERLEIFHAGVGDQRELQVQLAKVLKACEHFQIRVGHQTETEIHTRDPGTRIGLDNTALLGHPMRDVSPPCNAQANQRRNQRSSSQTRERASRCGSQKLTPVEHDTHPFRV